MEGTLHRLLGLALFIAVIGDADLGEAVAKCVARQTQQAGRLAEAYGWQAHKLGRPTEFTQLVSLDADYVKLRLIKSDEEIAWLRMRRAQALRRIEEERDLEAQD